MFKSKTEVKDFLPFNPETGYSGGFQPLTIKNNSQAEISGNYVVIFCVKEEQKEVFCTGR